MQISDELLVRLETAINTVMDDAEVDYPIGYHKGMHRVSWDAAEMRRALEAALSLPVQPVADAAPWGWANENGAVTRFYPDKWISLGQKLTPLYTTPPVPPTKGPEDDLRAARAAAKEAGGEHSYVAVQAALLALRSRPASALPVVKQMEWYPDPGAFPYNTWGAQSSFGRFTIEEVSASDSPAYEARYTPHHLIAIKDSLEDAKAAAQADYEYRIRSALTPSVQP